MVHVHFKEEIGIAELIPLVTTYIILFAYIYFSTRKCAWVSGSFSIYYHPPFYSVSVCVPVLDTPGTFR